MPRKARAVRRALLRKGFRETDSRHRKYQYHLLDGRETRIKTMMSHGSDRDVSDGLLAEMSRQLHLSRREFDQLIDCDLSQDDYEAQMRRYGFVR